MSDDDKSNSAMIMPPRGMMPLGILVGGRSSRMGTAKGWLEIDGEALVHRTIRVGREAGLWPVLVGDPKEYTQVLEVVSLSLSDDPVGIGPLGAISALAKRFPEFIAVACDMPYISAVSLRRLAEHASPAQVLSFGEPFPARYRGAQINEAIESGTRSFRRLFADREVATLPIDTDELRDWDSPSDIPWRDHPPLPPNK